MTIVERSRRFDASAADVWQRIGDFHGAHRWHPAIANSTAQEDGSVRELTLDDGAAIVERLIDQGSHSYSYRILDSPLPVADYEATLSVRDQDGGSVAVWQARFEPDGVSEVDAQELIGGIFQSGLDNL